MQFTHGHGAHRCQLQYLKPSRLVPWPYPTPRPQRFVKSATWAECRQEVGVVQERASYNLPRRIFDKEAAGQ